MANHDVKTFRFAGSCPSPHCVDVVEIQVTELGENNPQYQSIRYFLMTVYLHVIDDTFRISSTRALDYISMPTVI